VSSIDALQRYREDAGLLDLEGMQSVFTEQLKILASEISAAQRIRTEAENLYRRAQRMQATGQLDSLPVVFNNAWLQRLKEQEEGLERQIKLDSERFQGDYPGLDEDQQNLTALQEQINQTLIQIVEGMKTDYEVALANERQAEAKLIEIEEKVQNANRKEFQADALEQVVLSNRQSYDAFLSKLMETTTLGRDTISMIARVVDPAVSEIIPYKPKKLRMISVAVVLSLFAGVGFAFLLDRLDNTLKSREDVEDRLGLPVLGELIALTKKSSKQGDCNPATEYRDSPKSGYSESIRTVRTAVALSALDKSQNPVLMITSTLSGEGKSTIALNLAFAMSQLGNVLLLDGDLRRPKSAKLCGLDNKIKGLTDLIAGTAKVAECIHKVSGEIHLLPAGTTLPPDPLPMLSSERFSVLLQKLSTAYDTVIIDSAPVELVSDARLLATQATGLIYVVKADETPLQAVKQGLKSLKQTGIPILGAILNQIDPDKAQSYGKYKYGYNRYENYGYGEEVSKQA
jgi:capsular exopolysaccharide synthesis family protein